MEVINKEDVHILLDRKHINTSHIVFSTGQSRDKSRTDILHTNSVLIYVPVIMSSMAPSLPS